MLKMQINIGKMLAFLLHLYSCLRTEAQFAVEVDVNIVIKSSLLFQQQYKTAKLHNTQLYNKVHMTEYTIKRSEKQQQY